MAGNLQDKLISVVNSVAEDSVCFICVNCDIEGRGEQRVLTCIQRFRFFFRTHSAVFCPGFERDEELVKMVQTHYPAEYLEPYMPKFEVSSIGFDDEEVSDEA